MKASLFVAVTVVFCVFAYAGEIQKGASLQVKADSIWFQKSDQLAQWQELKKGGKAKAASAYGEKLLSNRDAWQFTKPLSVKILGYDAAKRRVQVEMTTSGRMQGTDWWLDDSAVVRFPSGVSTAR
jgi:hypothetical protein